MNSRIDKRDRITIPIIKKQKVKEESIYDELTEKACKDYLDKKLMLKDLFEIQKRNVVILLNKKVEVKGRRYLELVGLDVFTGKVIKIVDTNGAQFGLHTYNDKVAKLAIKTVIQATFKIYNNDTCLNVLRITSDFKVLGRSMLGKLREKYEYVDSEIIIDFVNKFNTVFKCWDFYKNKYAYFITEFRGSKVQKHNGKYQLKMDKNFVDIEKNVAELAKLENLYFRGWALIFVDYSESFGRPIIKVKEFYSSNFITEKQNHQLEFENDKRVMDRAMKRKWQKGYEFRGEQSEEPNLFDRMKIKRRSGESVVDEYDFSEYTIWRY